METVQKTKPTARKKWNYHPELPIKHQPIFVWPPQPMAAFVALTKKWVSLSAMMLSLIFALVFYAYLLPDTETMMELSIDWIGLMYVSNLVLFTAFAGSLHLYLFTFSAQGEKLKFDARDLAKNSGVFTFSDQVRDNMFWSLASGVTIWTAFEVLYFWATANGYVRMVTFSEAPVLIILTVLLLPAFTSMHFYWIHRMLHWPPLYKRVHYVHHRSINIGPWSGISMHPVEGAIFVSSVLIHFIVPSHPVVVLLHLYVRAIGPALSHAGFEKILVRDGKLMDAGHFHHQLHHRFFECNYGTPEMPWDEWFGSFHDGTDEATTRIRERKRKRHAS